MILAIEPVGLREPGLPPLLLRDTRHPRHDRRAVSLRWLGAAAGLAVAAAILVSLVLQAALHQAVRPRAPDFVLPFADSAHGSADGRSDRLPSRRPAPPAAGPLRVAPPSPVATKVLRSSALGDRPLTVLTADLAHMSALAGPDDGPAESGAPSSVLAHDRAASPVLAAALPGLFHFGALAATPPAHATSYVTAALPTITEPGPLGVPLNVTVRAGTPPPPPPAPDPVVVAGPGDTPGRLLRDFALPAAAAGEIGTVLGFERCVGGERLVLRLGEGAEGARGTVVRASLAGPDGTVRTAAVSDDGHYRPAVTRADEASLAAAVPPASAPAAVQGPVDDASLRDSLEALGGHGGLGKPLAAAVIRVLGAERDLADAVAASDRIEVLFGPAAEDGSGSQELAYAGLAADGRLTRLYRFAAPDDGSIDYYDAAGHSLSKFLLRKPVAAGQLGDGFGWRIHPVLGDRRFHEGVDYRAPYGSPIVAAGAGTVIKIDYESGYGKYIRIRHDLGYETTYAHVAGYPKGMAVGRRVQQGETIAFVGSTGLSTGNHLYYEVKINGRNVDPTRIKIASGRILDGAALTAFQRRRAQVDALLAAAHPGS